MHVLCIYVLKVSVRSHRIIYIKYVLLCVLFCDISQELCTFACIECSYIIRLVTVERQKHALQDSNFTEYKLC
jgi:hypothetical protein